MWTGSCQSCLLRRVGARRRSSQMNRRSWSTACLRCVIIRLQPPRQSGLKRVISCQPVRPTHAGLMVQLRVPPAKGHPPSATAATVPVTTTTPLSLHIPELTRRGARWWPGC
jgi:hypothetical protein